MHPFVGDMGEPTARSSFCPLPQFQPLLWHKMPEELPSKLASPHQRGKWVVTRPSRAPVAAGNS